MEIKEEPVQKKKIAARSAAAALQTQPSLTVSPTTNNEAPPDEIREHPRPAAYISGTAMRPKKKKAKSTDERKSKLTEPNPPTQPRQERKHPRSAARPRHVSTARSEAPRSCVKEGQHGACTPVAQRTRARIRRARARA